MRKTPVNARGTRARRLLLAAAVLLLSRPAMAVSGAELYAKMCASCHGADGRGSPGLARSFDVSPGVLNLVDGGGLSAGVVTDGRGKMPGFRKVLKPEDVAAVLGYVRGLGAARRGVNAPLPERAGTGTAADSGSKGAEPAGEAAPRGPEDESSGDRARADAGARAAAWPERQSRAARSAEAASSEVESPRATPPAVPALRLASSLRRAAVSPEVQAGFADDNREFGRCLEFLKKFKERTPIRLDVSSRIVFTVRDGQGMPASRASLVFRDHRGRPAATRTAYADGRAMLFPSEDDRYLGGPVEVTVEWGGGKRRLEIDPAGPRTVEIVMEGAAEVSDRIPVDICFLLDTTGSMGDEIARLKATLEVVHAGIVHLSPQPDVRFGMVLYRDRGDEYVTRKMDFTGDMGEFSGRLRGIRAEGGGDAPEDLQEGLRVALQELKWRDGAVRIIFLLTDARPQIYFGQRLDYVEAARLAAEKGIKIVGIGASGLPVDGEVALRQLAQYTMGRFVFLTYGETDESEGGTRTSVSHHTGANFQTRNLDAVIVRFVRRELAAIEGKDLPDEDWLETSPGERFDREKVLDELFAEGIRRLLDFSTVPLERATPTAVMPMLVEEEKLKAGAELLEHRLLLAVSRHPAFRMVERSDLRQVLEEQALGLTGVIEPEKAAKVGVVIGAKLLVVSRLTPGKPRHEVVLKLVRVETAEILAVSLLKVSPELVE